MQLIEGEDYYLENGLMVFTSRYHLKRGYCCSSSCRHCPYEVVQEVIDRNSNFELPQATDKTVLRPEKPNK
ncbi:MAG: DUF5522 domain-containing protein [Pyrinomonadaceae bacterium]